MLTFFFGEVLDGRNARVAEEPCGADELLPHTEAA
jgi:hypothetical protein